MLHVVCSFVLNHGDPWTPPSRIEGLTRYSVSKAISDANQSASALC